MNCSMVATHIKGTTCGLSRDYTHTAVGKCILANRPGIPGIVPTFTCLSRSPDLPSNVPGFQVVKVDCMAPPI